VDTIGGGANSAPLLKIFADVWGVPVRRRDLVDEATSVGAAVVGGVGVGLFDGFDVARRATDHHDPAPPDPDAHARYAAAHELFIDAYRRLEPWFDRL
jgi:xylulokinase